MEGTYNCRARERDRRITSQDKETKTYCSVDLSKVQYYDSQRGLSKNSYCVCRLIALLPHSILFYKIWNMNQNNFKS